MASRTWSQPSTSIQAAPTSSSAKGMERSPHRQPRFPADALPASIVVGDFNQDGKPDLAFGYSSGLQVFLGNGDGTFTQATGSPLTGAGLSLIAGDFNHDGKLDLAGIDNYNYLIDLFLGVGDGTFTQASTTPTVSLSVCRCHPFLDRCRRL